LDDPFSFFFFLSYYNQAPFSYKLTHIPLTKKVPQQRMADTVSILSISDPKRHFSDAGLTNCYLH